MKKTFYFLFVYLIMIASCKKDDSEEAIKYSSSGLFIINEGQFQGGNSSISYYRKGTDYFNIDIFSAINKLPLGDVAQSMTIFNNLGFIVVNNSKKVEVVNMTDFHRLTTITGLQSPRYFCGITASKGYVSDWTDNNIKIVDLINNSITGTIPCGSGPEQMVINGNKVFVCNSGGFTNDSTITVIDATTNSVLTTIQTGINPSSILQDINGKIWVLCSGTIGADQTPATSDDIGGTLMQMDPSNYAILKRIDFPTDLHPIKMTSNASKERLFYLAGNSGYTGKIYKISIGNNILPASAYIDREFYSLGIDPLSGYIYAGLGNFSTSTYVIKYQNNGTLIDSLKVGIAPNSFVFNY